MLTRGQAGDLGRVRLHDDVVALVVVEPDVHVVLAGAGRTERDAAGDLDRERHGDGRARGGFADRDGEVAGRAAARLPAAGSQREAGDQHQDRAEQECTAPAAPMSRRQVSCRHTSTYGRTGARRFLSRPEILLARRCVVPGVGVTDETLLAGMAAGDAQAAAVLVRRYQARVYGLALTIVGVPATAEEVAQDAFLRAWRVAGGYDPRRGAVATWLLTITRNAAIDTVRLRRDQPYQPDLVLALLDGQCADIGGEEAVAEADRVRAALR